MREMKCVNALKGATFISTKRSIMQKAIHLRLCQCPERGGLHFYEEKYDYALKQLLCVNALKGATFISTLASGNPCKSRLCGSIFPEVFQNIPKKAFLKGVFWKFTICSYLTVPFLHLVYLFFLGLRSTYSTLLIG